MNRLTIEEVEAELVFAKEGISPSFHPVAVLTKLLDTMRENERLRDALESVGGEMIYRRDNKRNAFFPMLEANARIIDALSNKDSDAKE